MVHIGIDARLTGYRVGGVSAYTHYLITALADLNPPEKFTVFHSRHASAKARTQFPTATLWTPPHHRLERWVLSAELLRWRLDILHSPDFIPPLYGANRHIITVHDLTFLHYPQHKDADSIRYYNGQIKMAVRQAAHILAVSEATKTDLKKMLNTPDEKISVQLHGVDARFHPLEPELLQKRRIELELPPTYILHVGTLEPRKNIPALIDVFIELHQSSPDTPPLLLVGKMGWLFDDTKMRIRRLQKDGVPIILRDDINDDALPAVYNLATVLVMPSFYEGFGMPALEAMACGTPTIVSDCSSLPEVVGETGLLIDPYNPKTLFHALERALSDPSWRRQSRQLGLVRAQQFSWRKSAEIALSVYRQTLGVAI
jgi:glycosyltransferase involved in cell wall biosynthesis